MKRDKAYWFSFLLIPAGIGLTYFLFQTETIYGGDAGDLASAVVTKGIAHPPGYPLYTVLGILLNSFIPRGTVAWRIGFVSSISSLLSYILLYDLFVYLTKRAFFSLLAVFSLSFIYPLWLYSEIVEVFALNNFFTISLLWLFTHFLKIKKGKNKYLYLGFFVLGLSFAHHHIIVFLFPALAYLFLKGLSGVSPGRWSGAIVVRSLLLFLLGLTPHLYIFISALSNPAVNWQGPPSLVNFFNLITRAGYGTFMAGSYIAHQPALRLLDVWAFFDFVYKDFRIFGILLFLCGFFYLKKKDRVLSRALLLGIFSYLFFLFYASFPLVEDFLVGTFERFVSPLYILMSLYLPFGFLSLELFLKKVISYLLDQKKGKIPYFGAIALFTIYPLGLFKLNVGKISILKKDFTAENLGRDILNSVPSDSILILSSDTPLFNTQYVYYTEKKWPGVKLIHFTKLFTPYYFETLKKYYPELKLYETKGTSKQQFQSFIKNNYEHFAIFSKSPLFLEEGTWIPHGLLFRFYRKEDVPSDERVLLSNEKLWESYHDPLKGSLSHFTNLILSDVLRIYSLAHQEIGFWAAKRSFTAEAEKHLLASEKLYPSDVDSFVILAQVYILEKKCLEAAQQIETILKNDPQNLESYYLLAINSAFCLQDSQKASYYQKLFEEKSRGREALLKKL